MSMSQAQKDAMRAGRERAKARKLIAQEQVSASTADIPSPGVYSITETELLDCALSAMRDCGGEYHGTGAMRAFSAHVRTLIVLKRSKQLGKP